MKLQDLPLSAIKVALEFSALAYGGFRTAKKFRCWWTSAEAYLHEGEDLDFLTFKGSSEPMDWLMNLTAIPIPAGTGFTHAGFTLAHWSIWRKIRKELTPGKPLVVTGHSLGGAMAERTCALMRSHPQLHMITFGKPNLFWANTAPSMNHLKAQISVVSGSDLVPRIPRIGYGPSKTQTMLYLANDGSHSINPSKQYLLDDWQLDGAVSDHSMNSYRERFNALLGV